MLTGEGGGGGGGKCLPSTETKAELLLAKNNNKQTKNRGRQRGAELFMYKRSTEICSSTKSFSTALSRIVVTDIVLHCTYSMAREFKYLE